MKYWCIPILATATFLLPALALPLAAGDNRWTSGGPYGGYIASLSYHPRSRNVVFAGSCAAGTEEGAGSDWMWQRGALSSGFIPSSQAG